MTTGDRLFRGKHPEALRERIEGEAQNGSRTTPQIIKDMMIAKLAFLGVIAVLEKPAIDTLTQPHPLSAAFAAAAAVVAGVYLAVRQASEIRSLATLKLDR